MERCWDIDMERQGDVEMWIDIEIQILKDRKIWRYVYKENGYIDK